MKDVGLWRVIIHGYPYQSIQQLGVANKEEAFTATKQAVYCYLYGNNPNDYGGIGEAGQRTLNALKSILNNANNSKETKISSTIQINKISNKWTQDKIDSKYISKEYEVKAGANMKNYQISISKNNGKDIKGIKITDMNNKEKNQFTTGEKFKVLVPIKNMTEAGSFKLTVKAEVETKPVLYGTAPNSDYQDYALTTATYEDGTGEKSDEYPKNETEIIIIKQDEKTKKRLENTEFEILDENKNVIYNDLKTDKEGKIVVKNMIPGKYYIRETKAAEGYERYEELIDIELSLHEQYTITINNNAEEEPKIDIEKKENNKEVSSSSVKREKLPVTGL